MPKSKTKAEQLHHQDVADLGCLVCKNNGHPGSPAEIHHIRDGAGIGRKASHFEVIPLCPPHHRTGGWGIAFHAGKREWEKNYGQQAVLLNQVERELIEYRERIVGRA